MLRDALRIARSCLLVLFAILFNPIGVKADISPLDKPGVEVSDLGTDSITIINAASDSICSIDSIAPECLTADSLMVDCNIESTENQVIWSLRTNVLYDAALVPNLGFDLYLSSGWSLSVFWTYAWWSKDSRHRFWRTYGADITARRWLGSVAREKLLTGHHIGVFVQSSTFDFELGGKGYMGGKPGGSLWDKMNWAAGVEYGYSLPLSRHLCVDFTFAVGYTDCTYHVYRPEDQCYVRESTKHLRTVLPTKAEVSLVWIFGNDRRNRQKGGDL